MCGDHDDHDHVDEEFFDRLVHFASHHNIQPDAAAGSTPATLADESMRSAYMEGLFRAALTRAINDTAHMSEGERIDLVTGQSIVFARLAGLLAGLLPRGSDQFHLVINALMQGYQEPAQHHHHHH